MAQNSFLQNGLIFGLALVVCASQAGGALKGGLAPQATLQEMINAAPDGGTVTLPAQAYSETLLVDKNLTLKGASNATTILQPASDSQRVIKVTGGHTLRLETLRVTGGHPTAAGDDAGGGVLLLDGASLEVWLCFIDGNSASYGGGVFQSGAGGSVTVSNSWIASNTAAFNGGGLFTEGNATLTATTLSGNTAGWHGGGLHVNSGRAQLAGGEVNGNHATAGNGGGVNVNNGLTVSGTQFADNTAGVSGGAITQWNSGQIVMISGAAFNTNSAKISGGGVFIRENFLTIDYTTFSTNTVASGSAGDVYGGGLYAGGGLNGSGLIFTANQASCTGCNFNSGGGLFVKRLADGASTVTLSTFDSNLAWTGSGISSATGVQLTVTSSSFLNNGDPLKAGYGAGVDAAWLNGDRLLFQNNQVLNNGGALAVNQGILTNSRLIGNICAAGKGGAIFANNSFSGTNLVFASNAASAGAALYTNMGPAVLRHASISRPTRGSGSAIMLFNSGGTLEVKNSIVSGYDTGIRSLGTLTEDYNLYYNNQADQDPPGSGTHSVYLKNPLFASLVGNDYHLRWPSPAIGKGTDLGVSSDLDGRPRLNRVDVGAYQFWASLYVAVVRK